MQLENFQLFYWETIFTKYKIFLLKTIEEMVKSDTPKMQTQTDSRVLSRGGVSCMLCKAFMKWLHSTAKTMLLSFYFWKFCLNETVCVSVCGYEVHCDVVHGEDSKVSLINLLHRGWQNLPSWRVNLFWGLDEGPVMVKYSYCIFCFPPFAP